MRELRRTRIPDFDRPVLKASIDKRLGLVNVLATILAIALATVPDGDALNLTMRVPQTATELMASLSDSEPIQLERQ